jgi:tetraacyldisaccharide 4'-kinase
VDLDIGSAVDEVGDEPLLVKQAHPEVRGAVCEDRLSGLSQLLAKGPLDFVVLDDAFQHRQLRSGFNILLTPFDRPFWSNHLLPEGTLRDVKRRVRAAHSIVITKCPTHISEKEMADYREKAEWHSASPVHFTTIDYGHLIDVRTDQETMVWPKAVVLFSGIANNTHLQRHVNDKSQILSEVQFKDHHLYGNEDVKKLKEICSKFAGRNPVLVTTSKDAVKLRSEGILNEFEGLEIYELPMRIRFLSDGFDEMLRAYARANKGDR